MESPSENQPGFQGIQRFSSMQKISNQKGQLFGTHGLGHVFLLPWPNFPQPPKKKRPS